MINKQRQKIIDLYFKNCLDYNFLKNDDAELKMDYNKNKNKPVLSVIIPSFNRKRFLFFVLNNFLNQNFPKSKYEIIIIDDGSDDGTFDKIKKIKPDCNLKYFYWPRGKIKIKNKFNKWIKFYNRVGPTRNIGLSNAQGDVVLFNDSDVLVDKNCLKKHMQYHNKYNNIVVRGFRNFLPKDFKPNLEKIKNFKFLKRISYPEREGKFKKIHCKKYNLDEKTWQRFVTANLSIRKIYLDKIGGFSKNFVSWGMEDTDLGYRLKDSKLKFVWDSKINVYHIHHLKEAGDDLNELLLFKLGLDVSQCSDYNIEKVFNNTISRRLDKIILKKIC